MWCLSLSQVKTPSSASYSARLSPSKPPDAWKTHLKSTVRKAHHLGVKEGLIPKEQQQRAAAGSMSTRQTGGSSSSMISKSQAMLLQSQLHSWQEMQTLPSKRNPGERRGLHMNGLCVYMCMHTCAACKTSIRVCMCTFTQWLLPVRAPCI